MPWSGYIESTMSNPPCQVTEVQVTVHRFAPVAEGPTAIVLVGVDSDGPFAALLAADRRYTSIPLTPGAAVELASMAHQLAAAAFLRCADALDPRAAAESIGLGIGTGARWRIGPTAGSDRELDGLQVALLRSSSVELLRSIAGLLTDRAVATACRP